MAGGSRGLRKEEGGRMKDEKEKNGSFLHPSDFILHLSKEGGMPGSYPGRGAA
jgi:hypothetical protein